MSTDVDVLKVEMRPHLKRSVTTLAGNVAGTTLIDNTLTEPDDFWNGMAILIRTAGATVDCSGQLRRIVDWDLATNTLTVNVPFTDPAHPADPKIEAGVQYVMAFPYSDPEVVAIEAKLDDPAHGLVKIKDEIIDVEAKLDDKIVGLASIKFEVAALEEKLDHPTHGLATIKSEIAAIEDKLDHETYGLANIKAEIVVIDTEIAAIEAKLDIIDGIVDDIKAKTENLPGANSKESDTFTWDTSVFLTNETDISALFTTPLTGTDMRKYSVLIDLTGPAGDGAAWTKCTVKVKVKTDAENYRTADKVEIAKTEVATGEEPNIEIDIPAVCQDVQITMQFNVALTADAIIYYSYVKEVLE